MDLSVIIVSYNVRHFLDQCLASVREAAESTDIEIYVVDNNSSDGSCSMVSIEYPEVRLIANSDNKGFSAANNQAIKQAAGRYILLLNPDTLIEEDTFKKCIRFMDEHPDAGATGVRMINGKGRFLPESKRAIPDPKTAFFKITGLSYLFPKSGLFNKYYLGNLDSFKTTEADIISGAFMFLRREAVKKTGLLDESFFMYGEDIDYSYRLLKAGYKNYYYPDARIIHFKGESTKKEDLNILVNFYNAMIIFVRKHYNNRKLRALVLPIRIAIFFSAGVSLLKRFIKRIFLHLTHNLSARCRKTVIVGDADGYKRITELISSKSISPEIAGRISINPGDNHGEVLGNIDQLKEVIMKNRINEVIFLTGKLRTSQIIDSMHLISDNDLSIKIASAGGRYLLGSGFVSSIQGSLPFKKSL